MIVLQDKALPSVMNEFESLSALDGKNCHPGKWGNRKQVFRWVNGIEYGFGQNGKKCRMPKRRNKNMLSNLFFNIHASALDPGTKN